MKVPKVPFSATPAGGETAMAATPQLPPVRLPPNEPRITPWITPPSPYSESPQGPRAVSPPPGRPHKFRPGEKLVLQDGRSLAVREARLALLDARGDVLRTFPPGVVVLVGSAGDVSIQSGPLNVPLGIARR